jgi:hypothetical protein
MLVQNNLSGNSIFILGASQRPVQSRPSLYLIALCSTILLTLLWVSTHNAQAFIHGNSSLFCRRVMNGETQDV